MCTDEDKTYENYVIYKVFVQLAYCCVFQLFRRGGQQRSPKYLLTPPVHQLQRLTSPPSAPSSQSLSSAHGRCFFDLLPRDRHLSDCDLLFSSNRRSQYSAGTRFSKYPKNFLSFPKSCCLSMTFSFLLYYLCTCIVYLHVFLIQLLAATQNKSLILIS